MFGKMILIASLFRHRKNVKYRENSAPLRLCQILRAWLYDTVVSNLAFYTKLIRLVITNNGD